MSPASCLLLLRRGDRSEVYIQASYIFTSNDIVVNGGVILAGVLVYFTQSRLPDLVIGGVVFAVVPSGAVRILRRSR